MDFDQSSFVPSDAVLRGEQLLHEARDYSMAMGFDQWTSVLSDEVSGEGCIPREMAYHPMEMESDRLISVLSGAAVAAEEGWVLREVVGCLMGMVSDR